MKRVVYLAAIVAVASACSGKTNPSSTASTAASSSSGSVATSSSTSPGSTTTTGSTSGSTASTGSSTSTSSTGSTVSSLSTSASASGTSSSASSSSGSTSGGSTGSFNLVVKENPNGVMSAIGQLSYPPGVVSANILITDSSGNDAGFTPPGFPLSGASPANLPILLLKANTPYSFTAVGVLADGGTVTSNAFPFTTGLLPAGSLSSVALVGGLTADYGGVPNFTVADGGQASAGFTLISNLTLASQIPAGKSVVKNVQQFVGAVDGTGQTVWYLALPVGGVLTGDFQKQPDGTYTVATYDESQNQIVGLPGNSVIYNQYDSLGNLLHQWKSPLGSVADPNVDGGAVTISATDEHEFRLVDDGGAGLLFGVNAINDFNTALLVDGGACATDGGPAVPGGSCSVNASGVCACSATLFSYELEKVAIDGGVVWDWNAYDHVPPECIDPGQLNTPNLVDGTTVDGYHANSIDTMTDGTYLVSFRDMSTIVDVDPTDGHVIWKLGGVCSDFVFMNDPDKPLPGPSFQHFVRQLPSSDGLIHIYMFDDGNTHNPEVSRGVEYVLDTSKKTATMVWEQTSSSPNRIFGYALGSTEFLPNGDTLICYGARISSAGLSAPPPPHVQEYDPDGGLLWDLSDDILLTNADGGVLTYSDGRLVASPDGGSTIALPDGGSYSSKFTGRDFGFYRAFRLDTVY